jgi:hypothetical protein
MLRYCPRATTLWSGGFQQYDATLHRHALPVRDILTGAGSIALSVYLNNRSTHPWPGLRRHVEPLDIEPTSLTITGDLSCGPTSSNGLARGVTISIFNATDDLFAHVR